MDYMVGEIHLFPYNFVPVGWIKCDGTVLQIQQNAALYSLIGVTFGGNGTTNFQVPDLRNAIPIPYLGNGMPNNNMVYCICTQGMYPQRP